MSGADISHCFSARPDGYTAPWPHNFLVSILLLGGMDESFVLLPACTCMSSTHSAARYKSRPRCYRFSSSRVSLVVGAFKKGGSGDNASILRQGGDFTTSKGNIRKFMFNILDV